MKIKKVETIEINGFNWIKEDILLKGNPHNLYDIDKRGIWYANDVRDLKTRYSLFLPSGGYCPPGSTTPNYGVYGIGIYWANSFLLEDNVWHLYFDSDSIPGVDRYFREYKFTVRFVSDL